MGRAACPIGGVSIGIAMKDERKDEEGVVLTEAQKRARSSRSIAIAWVLAALALLFFIMTMVNGPAVLQRPL